MPVRKYIYARSPKAIGLLAYFYNRRIIGRYAYNIRHKRSSMFHFVI